MSRSVTCTLCRNDLNVKFNTSEYINHVRLFHAYKPDFRITCGINGCLRSYTNLGTFKNHVSAAHYSDDQCRDSQVVSNDEGLICYNDDPNTSDEDLQSDSDDEYSEPDSDFSIVNAVTDTALDAEESNSDLMECSKELLQKSSASFLLGLKERFKLTQAAIQGIIEGVTSITQQRINVLKSQVHVCMILVFLHHEHLQVYSTLNRTNITPSHVEGLNECFSDFNNIFFGLETQHQQMQYMKKHFNLIVSTNIAITI